MGVGYFTKWVEAETLASITSQVVEKLIWKNIICCFGLSHAIISDNDTQFVSRQTISFLSGLGIRNNFTFVSHPASNGLIEVTNKTIVNNLKKKVHENQKDWSDMLEEILWTYRTTPRESTQQSPYSLVYIMEAVTPIELVTPSFHIDSYDEARNGETRATDLGLLSKIRERVQI
jgi:transposase InsO family protein